MIIRNYHGRFAIESKTIKCPQCKKPSVYSQENTFRPFCSERCRILDLGSWADERYAVPIEDASSALEEDDSQGNSDEEPPAMH